MAKYEVEINGEKYEVDAPDEQSLGIAVKQLQEQVAPPPAATAPEFSGGMPGAAALGAADTASFGFGDELGAGLGAVSEYLASKVTGDEPRSYDTLLAEMRGQDAAAKEENPGSYLAGQVAGGVGMGVAAGPAVLAAPTTLGRVAVGAGTSAAGGGAYGFGSGEGGVGPRVENAAVQGGIGGVIGGALPVVGTAGSAAYKGVRDWMAKRSAAKTAGAAPEAVERITQLLAADGTLGPQGQANMARAGGNAMLADAGPNAQQALDAAVQFGGRGSNATRQAIEERALRSADDMQRSMDLHLGGPPVGVETARAGIRNAARPALNEAYETAYSLPVNYADETGQRLEQMVKNRVPKKAIDAANELMRVNGESSKQILAQVDDAGNAVFETLPDVRQIDYITRGLRQMAESGEGQGALGGQTTLGSAYQNLARDMRSTLREAVPEYGRALDTAADPISRSQAVKFGSNILTRGTTRDEVAREVAGMSAAEKQAAAQGIRAQIDEQMANVQRALTDPNMDAREAVNGLKTLSSRAVREKVATVIGDDAAAQLFGDIDRASTSFDLRAAIANNSKTFTRQAMDEGISAAVEPNAVQKLLSGRPIKAGQALAESAVGVSPTQLNTQKQEIYAQIADLLTRPANQAIPAFNAMTDSAAAQAQNAITADLIRRVVSGSAAPAAYPSSVLLQGNRQ